MFYSQLILAKKGPLGTIWIAAHLERKLRKNQVTETNISVSVGTYSCSFTRNVSFVFEVKHSSATCGDSFPNEVFLNSRHSEVSITTCERFCQVGSSGGKDGSCLTVCSDSEGLIGAVVAEDGLKLR